MIFHFVVQTPSFPVSTRDIELVFGALCSTDKLIEISTADLAEMAVQAGIFPSKGQSRKNGLDGPAPTGLHLIGTRKRRFWVWNPTAPVEKITFNLSFDRTQGWFK